MADGHRDGDAEAMFGLERLAAFIGRGKAIGAKRACGDIDRAELGNDLRARCEAPVHIDGGGDFGQRGADAVADRAFNEGQPLMLDLGRANKRRDR